MASVTSRTVFDLKSEQGIKDAIRIVRIQLQRLRSFGPDQQIPEAEAQLSELKEMLKKYK